MGEIAEMMLDGTMCAGCGEFLHGGADGYGFPEYCYACRSEYREPKVEKKEWKRAEALSEMFVDMIEEAIGGKFPSDIRAHVHSGINGIVKPCWLEGNKIRHIPLEKTLENNRNARKKKRK